MIRIAAIGDIHTCFDDTDVELFNDSDYDLILICGDLPGRSHKQTLTVASTLAGLSRPALLIPGNHDSTTVLQLLGEVTGSKRLKQWDERGIEKMRSRVKDLEQALGPVKLGGYSLHPFHPDRGWVESGPLDIIVARPHSMGGPGIGFAPYIESAFAVRNITESGEKIQELILRSKAKTRLVLAHNGPEGLGHRPDDIWGCDFDPSRGDFGDPDLKMALDNAAAKGQEVQTVLAGNMHHALKGGGQRKWYVCREKTHYVNAARVPRIFSKNGEKQRHHVRIELDNTDVRVEQIYW